MIIAIDFDGTIVSQDGPYDAAAPEFLPGAKDALLALQRAGHRLLLWSARANLANRENWRRNPLWTEEPPGWENDRELNEQRYQVMCRFVASELPGVFAAVDDGRQGKPVGVDLFIDDKAIGLGPLGLEWKQIAYRLGEPEHVGTRPGR